MADEGSEHMTYANMFKHVDNGQFGLYLELLAGLESITGNMFIKRTHT